MILLFLACTTSTPATPAAAGGLPFKLTSIASVTAPTAITSTPNGSLLVLQQPGTLIQIDGQHTSTLLDISKSIKSGGETGLLGVALAKDFPTDPRIFFNYTVMEGKQLKTRVVSMVWNGRDAIDPASERLLLEFDQPYSNHNGGGLAMAPDGTLFIAVGDGGSANDPKATGQNKTDFLGSILRIDPTPEGDRGYRIPADNPFVGEVRPEIWAYGVRNPWGMHFDGETLYFADVGQNQWEEVNRGFKGGNYGWNALEGTHCFTPATCPVVQPVSVLPLAEYGHDVGQSVTGGVVYRGPSIPMLDNKYLYADFVTGNLWALPVAGGESSLVGNSGLMISSFGVDRQSRVYVGDYKGGLYRIDPQ